MTQATTAGIGTTTYTYGANGERVARTGVLGSTGFLVDPFAPTGTSEVAAEYDAAGVTTSSFTYGPELLSQHSGGATSYVHADAVGRSEEPPSELPSLMPIPYSVFLLKNNNK